MPENSGMAQNPSLREFGKEQQGSRLGLLCSKAQIKDALWK